MSISHLKPVKAYKVFAVRDGKLTSVGGGLSKLGLVKEYPIKGIVRCDIGRMFVFTELSKAISFLDSRDTPMNHVELWEVKTWNPKAVDFVPHVWELNIPIEDVKDYWNESKRSRLNAAIFSPISPKIKSVSALQLVNKIMDNKRGFNYVKKL